jgi:hypothetical protein
MEVHLESCRALVDLEGLSRPAVTAEPLRCLVPAGEAVSSLAGKEQGSSPLLALHLDLCPRITSLAPLAGLKRVQCLLLARCEQLRGLEGIEQALSLYYLCVALCPITSLAPMAGLTSLRRLNLLRCERLSSLAGIEQALLLRELRVRECPRIKSLAPLAALSKLQRLSLLSCKQLTSLAGIEQASLL